jgi:hypothetical protein
MPSEFGLRIPRGNPADRYAVKRADLHREPILCAAASLPSSPWSLCAYH